jgi:hypothetical protein
VLAGALTSACATLERATTPWWQGRTDSSGQAPDPARTPEPVLQVYGARAVGWRGVFAVHTWIAVKRAHAPAYTRYEVIGWRVDRGQQAVRVNRAGPDDHWFGARPDRLLDLRGEGVEALIDRVEAAVPRYPYGRRYRIWPGPNSNTFIAWVARAVPELRLHLPPTAIGKDYLPDGALLATSPSGLGMQVSLAGAAGVLVGWEEGIEVNVLGLTFGVDVRRPALKVPFAGRLGWPVPYTPDGSIPEEIETWPTSPPPSTTSTSSSATPSARTAGTPTSWASTPRTR